MASSFFLLYTFGGFVLAFHYAHGQCGVGEDFSISYNSGVTAFSVSSKNMSCTCAGGFVGDGSQLANLIANPVIAALVTTVAQLQQSNTQLLARLAALETATMPCTPGSCPSNSSCSPVSNVCKKTAASTCVTRAECLEGMSCSNGSCAALAASCQALRLDTNFAYAGADGYYWVNPTLQTASPNASFAQLHYCDMTTDNGGWTLLLNVDTADGNVLHWDNTQFWTDPALPGGAQSDATKWKGKDYKNALAYASMPMNQIMILKHVNGVPGVWRSWVLVNRTQPLRNYLNFNVRANFKMTTSVRAGTFSTSVTNDPVMYSNYQLYSATCTCGVGYEDWNRISWLSPTHTNCGTASTNGNCGWGLGTSYDRVPADFVYCSRPCADAMAVSAEGSNWANGLIGTDVLPSNQYGTSSGSSHDYAIFGRLYDVFEGGACVGTPVTCSNSLYVCSGYSSSCRIPPGSSATVCLLDSHCLQGSTCVSGVCTVQTASLLASCEAVKTANPTSGDGYYLVNPTLATGSPNTGFFALIYCDMTNDLGGWMLTMGLDTNDGNVVSYSNANFWSDPTALGGATSDVFAAWTRDYKNTALFASYPMKAIMIRVHIDGVTQYWRSWNTASTTQPLRYYFATPALYTAANLAVTSSVRATGGSVWSSDPVIAGSNNLFSHTCTGADDYNRLSQLPSGHGACGSTNNQGWGFGSSYDYLPASYPVCSRPCSDVEAIATINTNWAGGIVGSDILPSNQYGSQPSSPYANYNYAIFVR